MARNGTVCHAGNSRIAARLRPANAAQAMSGATGRSRRRPPRGAGPAGRPVAGTAGVRRGRGWLVAADKVLRPHDPLPTWTRDRPGADNSGKSTPSLPRRPIQVNRGRPVLGNVGRMADALPGRPSPLGATPRDGGINFAVASSVAEAAEVCLFDDAGDETRFRLPDYDGGAWHGFVPGVRPGRRPTGSACTGRTTPPAGCAATRPSCCSTRTRGRCAARSRSAPRCSTTPGTTTTRPARSTPPGTCRSAWSRTRPSTGAPTPRSRRDFADTVIYEVHVKGFTMRHPGVPAELRGTYAGLAHESVRSYLSDLGVTAVELLPGAPVCARRVPAASGG